jgi:hypothetical protein
MPPKPITRRVLDARLCFTVETETGLSTDYTDYTDYNNNLRNLRNLWIVIFCWIGRGLLAARPRLLQPADRRW